MQSNKNRKQGEFFSFSSLPPPPNFIRKPNGTADRKPEPQSPAYSIFTNVYDCRRLALHLKEDAPSCMRNFCAGSG